MNPPRLERSGLHWRARWFDSEGRKRSRGLGRTDALSEKAARRALGEFTTEMGATPGQRDAHGRTTLGAWCIRYGILKTDQAEGTADLLATTFGWLLKKLGADTRMDRITPAAAADWALWLGQQTSARRKLPDGTHAPLSPATVDMHIRNARAVFAQAVREHVIAANPFAGVKSPAPGDPTPWRMVTLEEFEAIQSACPSHAWRCLFGLCRLGGTRLGIRGGEALGLAWTDVDWTARTMRVRDQKRNRTRIVPICPRLYQILRAAFEADPVGLVCQVDHGKLYPEAERIIAGAGIELYPKLFHSLRKSCESELLASHALPDVCKWLGNSPAVALKLYHQPTAASVAKMTGAASP